jgi:hypothetical protein
MSLKIISWNIGHRSNVWREVAGLDADVALLQEACEPPTDVKSRVALDPEPWMTGGVAKRPWRTAVVGLRPDLFIRRIPVRSLDEAGRDDLAVSRIGSLAAAQIDVAPAQPAMILVSMYSVWESPYAGGEGSWIFADASAHRLISDISGLVARQKGHRIIASGDLNSLYGHGENGSPYWGARYQTIFDRFAAIGLVFVGPQSPNGRQADPWPSELPATSRNVPTYYTSHQTPATATRQLDFAFASADIASQVDVRALNTIDNWGPSDHCRLEITVRDV